MIKVLHILNGLGHGGAESMVMNIYGNIDRSEVQFDFLTRGENDINLVKEVQKKGGNIFNMPPYPKRILENYKQTEEFFKEHGNEYDIIHIHANSAIYIKPVYLAKKYGIKVILHSHSTHAYREYFKIIHKFNYKKMKKYIDMRVACSINAGKWMFDNDKYTVFNNAIDLDKYNYNEKIRKEIRKKHNIEDKYVIGHVGRFVKAKNHVFLIKIFSEYIKQNNDAVLLLIGDGELKSNIEELVMRKELSEKVIFTGNIDNVNEYMQAMDIFLLPSLYEGAPVAAIEAQASGLRVISSAVPVESKIISENVESISLEEPVEKWVECINKYNSIHSDRIIDNERFADAGYSIKEQAAKMLDYYKSLKER